MGFRRDRPARFARLRLGKHTSLTVGVTASNFTCNAKAVAVTLFNYGDEDVFFRTDGTAATTASGFPIISKQQTTTIDVRGSQVTFSLISGTAGQRVEAFEILDEA